MTAPTPAEERRQHPRYPVEVRVQVSQLGEVSGGLTRDVSHGGLFIESRFFFPIGATLPVRITHPRTAVQLPVLCVVVRHEEGSTPELHGVGLRFAATAAAEVKRLQEFLADIAAPEHRAGTTPPATGSPPPPPAVAPAPPDPSPAAAPTTPSSLAILVPVDRVPTPTTLERPAGLHPLLLHLLRFVDGHCDADQVSQRSGTSLVETLAGLLRLTQLGVIELHEPAAAPAASPAASLTTAEHEAAQGFAEQKLHEYLTEAVRAERAGRFADAVDALERALSLKPPQAADISARLTRLLAELSVREQAAAAERAAKRPGATAGPVVVHKGAASSVRQRLRGVVSVLSIAAFVGTGGWVAWHTLFVHGPKPTLVDLPAVRRFLPATGAQLLERRLYVKVDSRWDKLMPAERQQALTQLWTWSLATYKTEEIVVSDAQPLLVATVHDGQVEILH